MEKTREGYLKLFSMAKTDLVKAKFIISEIPPSNHDIGQLLSFQTVGDKFVVSMSKEILFSLPKDCFSYKILSKYLISKNQRIVNAATLLLLTHFSKNFDCKKLIKLQGSINPEIRALSKKIAHEIPIKKLDHKLLIESQESGDLDGRTLARELAFKIEVSRLIEVKSELVFYSKSDDLEIQILANDLLSKIELSNPHVVELKNNFIAEYFSTTT